MICKLPRKIVAEPAMPTLREVLADMTLIADYSRNLSSQGEIGPIARSNIPASGAAYFLSISDGYIGIWKATSSSIPGTPINAYGYNGAGNSGQCSIRVYNNNVYWDTQFSTAGISSLAYGASLVLVRFPSYTAAQTDAVLSAMSLVKVAGRNASTTGYVRTNTDKSHAFYLTTRYKMNGSSYTGYGADTGLVIWECDGSTWTKFNQVTPNWQAGAVSSGYLTLGAGTYGASIIGID
ncbi:MAG: hypothetical protein IKZ82_06170 [Clostridia bacterium]|nr:hypothetical protein [Clostridia bacterium]